MYEGRIIIKINGAYMGKCRRRVRPKRRRNEVAKRVFRTEGAKGRGWL